MRAAREFDGVEAAELPAVPLHLAIGIFDGVHLGHRAVIESAVHSAHRSGGHAAVLTFAPHPSVLLRPQQPTRLMMSRAAKVRILGQLGIDSVITQPFTAAFAEMKAEEFVPWLKKCLPRLAGVYVGENWRFGKGRAGDVAFLVAEGRRHGIHVFSAPRVSLDGDPISSSRIRTLIEDGEIAAANTMLGQAYASDGVIADGKKLGRTIGFPTLNVPWSPELRPRFGVYAVRVTGLKSHSALNAVANYGLRPTVENATVPRLEVHVLGECPYTTGDAITVGWLTFLRPENKFGSLDELRAQIARDREAAVRYFSSRS